MKTYIRREGWRVALVLDDPEVVPRERGILAAMNCLEGTGCWRLVDLRLSQYRKPSRYSGDMSADVYHANIKPDSEREAVLVKSMLREYREDEDGTIRWCSFDGLVRGHPEVDGYRPVSYANFDQAGYFAYAEAFAQLEEIKRWWDVYEGDPAHARIENGHRQVAEGTVLGEIVYLRMYMKDVEPRVLVLPALEKKAGAAYSLWESASAAIKAAGGDASMVNWKRVEDEVIRAAIGEHGQPREVVQAVLFEHSPGAVKAYQCEAIANRIEDFVARMHSEQAAEITSADPDMQA